MKIKNYTSTVPTSITIARIEAMLCEAGATGVSKNYSGGVVSNLSFRIQIPGKDKDNEMEIQLPANAGAVYQVLRAEFKRPLKIPAIEKLKQQSQRTAWKLMQEWVEVQLSLIKMQQVEFLQVFMPYVWDGRQTFYQALRDKGFKALPAPAADSKHS